VSPRGIAVFEASISREYYVPAVVRQVSGARYRRNKSILSLERTLCHPRSPSLVACSWNFAHCLSHSLLSHFALKCCTPVKRPAGPRSVVTDEYLSHAPPSKLPVDPSLLDLALSIERHTNISSPPNRVERKHPQIDFCAPRHVLQTLEKRSV
jgi:hypothetical protein